MILKKVIMTKKINNVLSLLTNRAKELKKHFIYSHYWGSQSTCEKQAELNLNKQKEIKENLKDIDFLLICLLNKKEIKNFLKL